MSNTLRELAAHIEKLWPIAGQEDWDNSGVVAGMREQPVKSVLFAVDVTNDVVTEAIDGGYDAIVSHHPLLLRGLTTVAEDRYKGDVIGRLIRANCALIAIHTNGDRVPTGTSARFAGVIGVESDGPLVPHALGGGLGIVGRVKPQTLGDFARAIAAVLPATAGGVRVSGDFAKPITTVSLCAGAGDSLLSNDLVTSSDVFITSDLRHHPASEFREQARLDNDTALIDVSHWAAEWLWLDQAAQELGAAMPDVKISVSQMNTDPWTFVVTQ